MQPNNISLWIGSGLFLALLPWLSGCQGSAAHANPAAAKKGEEAGPVAVTVAPVAVRKVQRRIALVGTLNALETVALSPKVGGLASKVLVDEGDRIQAESPLLEIEPTDYELAVAEAQSSVERELAKIGLTKMPDAKFDIEALPNVIRAKAIWQNAVKIQERMRSLVERKATTLQEYDDAVTKVQVEQASYRQTLLEAQATMAAARHADSVLATAKRKLADTQVLAPKLLLPGKQDPRIKGYVVTKRETATGEMVAPTKPVFELVVDDLLKLKATVPERHAGEVHLGQQVELSIEAYPKEIFRATVSRISPTIDQQSRTFAIEAIVANEDHRLKHGAFAKASVITRAESQAITVPLEAIVSFAGVTKVFVVQDGKAQGIEVALGVQGEQWVEVTGKLEAGASVVTTGQSQLANGTPVEIRK